jgi:hypothetical protein
LRRLPRRHARAADLVDDPRLDDGEAGVDAELVRPPAALAPTHDAGLVVVARLIGHHERAAAVALAGVLATFGKAGAQHDVGDRAAIGRESVAGLVGDDLHRHVAQHTRHLRAFRRQPPARNDRQTAGSGQTLSLGDRKQRDGSPGIRLREMNQGDVIVLRSGVVILVDDHPVRQIDRPAALQRVAAAPNLNAACRIRFDAVRRGQHPFGSDEGTAAKVAVLRIDAFQADRRYPGIRADGRRVAANDPRLDVQQPLACRHMLDGVAHDQWNIALRCGLAARIKTPGSDALEAVFGVKRRHSQDGCSASGDDSRCQRRNRAPFSSTRRRSHVSKPRIW